MISRLRVTEPDFKLNAGPRLFVGMLLPFSIVGILRHTHARLRDYPIRYGADAIEIWMRRPADGNRPAAYDPPGYGLVMRRRARELPHDD